MSSKKNSLVASPTLGRPREGPEPRELGWTRGPFLLCTMSHCALERGQCMPGQGRLRTKSPLSPSPPERHSAWVPPDSSVALLAPGPCAAPHADPSVRTQGPLGLSRSPQMAAWAHVAHCGVTRQDGGSAVCGFLWKDLEAGPEQVLGSSASLLGNFPPTFHLCRNS